MLITAAGSNLRLFFVASPMLIAYNHRMTLSAYGIEKKKV
jgi:hypothetical protein